MNNTFYFKNKNQDNKVCYEAIGKDVFTGIRYSIGLAGTRKAAENILNNYIKKKTPAYIVLQSKRPDISHLFDIEKTTIAEYRERIYAELDLRRTLMFHRDNHLCFINSCWHEIVPKIIECAKEIGKHEFSFGNYELDEIIFNCTDCIVTKRILSDSTSDQVVEFVLEIVFHQAKEGPIGRTYNQSIVLFRGSDAELSDYIHNEAFEGICKNFFYDAINNHIYGLACLNSLYNSPIYEDRNRSNGELLHNYFKGFIYEPGIPYPNFRKVIQNSCHK